MHPNCAISVPGNAPLRLWPALFRRAMRELTTPKAERLPAAEMVELAADFEAAKAKILGEGAAA